MQVSEKNSPCEGCKDVMPRKDDKAKMIQKKYLGMIE